MLGLQRRGRVFELLRRGRVSVAAARTRVCRDVDMTPSAAPRTPGDTNAIAWDCMAIQSSSNPRTPGDTSVTALWKKGAGCHTPRLTVHPDKVGTAFMHTANLSSRGIQELSVCDIRIGGLGLALVKRTQRCAPPPGANVDLYGQKASDSDN